jgi:hypothetical protein
MKVLGRVLGSTAFVLLLVAGARADTIYMKDGSVLRGTVVGYGDGQFTVLLSSGGQSRAMLVGSEIDRIEFDGSTGRPSAYSQPAPTSPAPRNDGAYRDNSTDTGSSSSLPAGNSGSYDVATPGTSEVLREADVSVQAKVDWTPSQVRVRRGDRVSITASGSVQLDKTGRRSSSPDGVNSPDRDKLLTSRPTGALIAVVGDDNDDFIYVGQRSEFTAARDGMLFLSVNEGDLSDNSGSYRAHVAVAGAGGPAPATTAAKTKAKQSPPPARPPVEARNDPIPSTPEPEPSGSDVSSLPSNEPSNAGSTGTAASAPTSRPAASTSANPAVREADIVVQAKNDWTSTQLQVQRGARIRVSAAGVVQLDKTGQKTTSPAGIEIQDRSKLLPDRPTGALIAVIGDDNDDFIFVGQEGEFVATRDGLLFLSINEGELSDNSGAFNVRVVVEQPRTVAKQ